MSVTAAALAGFGPTVPLRFAVAVSGGSDSLAALHLLAAAHPGRIFAVTVDHALRDGSAAEATEVGRICAGLHIPHQTLRWDHGALHGNLQDQARKARYGLMANWARGQGIADIVLAHTADDQAETLLMGLARRAGIDGLSGLRPDWHDDGIHWHRPFLAVTRQALRDVLRTKGQVWADDPSNQNDQFQRVKARKALSLLRPLGLTAETLAQTARHLAQAQDALNQTLSNWVAAHATQPAGSLQFATADFANLPPELQRRLVSAALEWIGGAGHPARAEGVARLVTAISQGKAATLAGCRLRHIGSGKVELHREYNAVAALACPPDQLWDGRWRLAQPSPEHSSDALQIKPLGPDGLRLCPDWRSTGYTRLTLLASPAIWSNTQLIAAPLAGKPNGWHANLTTSFDRFILSH